MQTSFVAIAVWLFALTSSSWSQPSTSAFEDGPFQDVSASMQDLVRIKIVNRQLEMRRDWGSKDNQKDPQDLIDEEIARLKKRGWDANTAAQVAERNIRGRLAENPFTTVFFALSSRRSGSMQRTSSGSRKTMSFSNSVMKASGELTLPDKGVLIRVFERNGPRRELIIEQQKDSQFFFKYAGNDFLVELQQNAENGVSLTRQLDEKKEKYNATDFISLRQQHPKLIDGWLLPLMEHVGFSVPLLADNNEIVDAVFAKLASYQRRTGEFEKLVKKLDASDYETRNRASEQILANKDDWKGQIEKKLESDSLSLESRVRLKAALSASNTESQVDELIREQDLLNSPKYLIGLLEIAETDQTQLVINRLQQVTGLRFSKSQQWKNWWQEKTDQENSNPDPRGNNSEK